MATHTNNYIALNEATRNLLHLIHNNTQTNPDQHLHHFIQELNNYDEATHEQHSQTLHNMFKDVNKIIDHQGEIEYKTNSVIHALERLNPNHE